MLAGFEHWVAVITRDAKKISGPQRHIADKLVQVASTFESRFEAGLQFLLTSFEARLCFNFAMKSIAMQNDWPHKQSEPFAWRPFQLAFILLTLKSAVINDASDRSICDLLWVATGGGKTETYLALTAFVLAYRRRRALGRASGDKTGAGVGVLSRYTLRLLTIQQFRRALKLITAMEKLRVIESNGSFGWRPPKSNTNDVWVWGSSDSA